ncbi:hypothetical protein GCM10011343_20490 [Flavobacterium orientale]|uniref:Uncharacterized protein n=2 Tax=Flavobacterium orientale TaxID=1756020 RepID=A0A917DEE0_9FLAO|nr:hypothetical protein GCM10011343_20490 [Flavobacterium orientale]
MLLLGVYHIPFVVVSYYHRDARGHSDAHTYWSVYKDISERSWFSFLDFSTDFILFLNYYPIKLGLPFWFGFLVYGCIGYLGYYYFLKFTLIVFKDSSKKYLTPIIILVALWPSLHYWTATLGKEPIVFLSLSYIFWATVSTNRSLLKMGIAFLFLAFIRPHVALFLLTAYAIVGLFYFKTTLKRKSLFTVCALLVGGFLVHQVLQIARIKRLDWERIKRFNDFSLSSFSSSGSYVPMESYTLFYKMFSFYFRPLASDVKSLVQFFAAVENYVLLSLHVVALGMLLLYFHKLKKLRLSFMWWVSFIFMLICGVIYIWRYANLGIFMRTKIMYAPFWTVSLLYLIILLLPQSTNVIRKQHEGN